MENKFSYALVGAFVIGFILIIMAISVWLTSGTEKINTIQYKVITDESVSGLSINSQIDYRGVNVGKVTDISLDRNDPAFVTILLEIHEDTPIKKDTKAVLMGKGITGLVSVSLTGGSAEAKPLKPTKSNPVPIIPNGPSLSKRLNEAFENVTIAVGSLSDQLGNILTQENIDRAAQIVANIEKITNDLADTTPEVKGLVSDTRDLVNGIKPKLETAANSLNKIKDVIDILKESSENIDDFMASLADVPGNVNDTVIGWRNVANTADSQMRNVLPQLQVTLDKLSRFIDNLNDNPNSLLMGSPQGKRGPGE